MKKKFDKNCKKHLYSNIIHFLMYAFHTVLQYGPFSFALSQFSVIETPANENVLFWNVKNGLYITNQEFVI